MRCSLLGNGAVHDPQLLQEIQKECLFLFRVATFSVVAKSQNQAIWCTSAWGAWRTTGVDGARMVLRATMLHTALLVSLATQGEGSGEHSCDWRYNDLYWDLSPLVKHKCAAAHPATLPFSACGESKAKASHFACSAVCCHSFLCGFCPDPTGLRLRDRRAARRQGRCAQFRLREQAVAGLQGCAGQLGVRHECMR